MEEIYKILPLNIVNELKSIGGNYNINEIRLRVGKNVIVKNSNNELKLQSIPTLKNILDILIKVSQNSIYAIQNEINNGYVVIKGGHRIGLCGEVVIDNGKIKNIKNINSMNIRVARQLIGASDKVIPYIIKDGNVKNTLIVSPPGCGKTTILRDIIRQISNGVDFLNFNGKNVGVVDERGEIAAVCQGIPNLDIGFRSDVISNVPKKIGMEMMIRSMGIDVLSTDEIGNEGDIEAIKYASSSGVSLIFTMHGRSISDVFQKSSLKELFDEKIFQNVIFLSNKEGPGTIEKIYNLDDIENKN